MDFPKMLRSLPLCLAGVCIAAAFAACGGGNSGGSPAVPAPSSPPGAPAVHASISIPASEVATPIPLPSLPGVTGTITLPANTAPAGTSITITTSATLPSFVSGAPESGSVIFLAITLSASHDITFQGHPKFAVTLQQPPVNRGAYFAWMFDPVKQWQDYAALSVSANTLTFGGDTSNFTLAQNVSTVIVPLTASAGASCPTPFPPSPTPSPSPTATPVPTPKPTPVANAMYIAQSTRILVFPFDASGNVAPSYTIAGCILDLSFAECPGDDRTIVFPGQLALDAAHDLYVANESTSPSSVAVFAPGTVGAAPPLRWIHGSDTQMLQAVGVALDSAGEIFVVDSPDVPDGYVTVYPEGANGNVAPIRRFRGDFGTGTAGTSPFNHPIAIDNAQGVAYIANNGFDSVNVYPLDAQGTVTPLRTISGTNTGLSAPAGIAVDGSGNVYVSNMNADSITVYAPSSSGNATPVRTISGSNTQLSRPGFLTLDSTGAIYVVDTGSKAVTVYAPGANGTVSPIRVLQGSNTLLSSDFDHGIAVDR